MKILFWHGFFPDDKKIKVMIAKLEKMGCYQQEQDGGTVWIYPDHIGKFADKWDDKFLAKKCNNEWVVYISQHGNFGQRR